ncbi:DNA replication protein [Paenibacillus selenitireducens]|uniref:DNA replication protein n=2 Tax=Paenibacillus selenitireducens TaxID=1324314 RepID=A0A1T2XD87_9BACL|nr:DNA replication protein [Paenibacillus selenitireducens]
MPNDYANKLKRMQEALNNHPDVIALKDSHPDRKAKESELFHYAQSCTRCRSCPGLEDCRNEMSGHRLVPVPDQLKPDLLNFALRPCKLQEASMKQLQIQKLIRCHNVKDYIKNSIFDDLDIDQRKAAIVECIRFCNDFKPNETKEGLYLYGSYGVGKSRIAGAIANELAKQGVDVALVYVPDFLEEMKDSISDNTVQQKVDALKRVTVLILDDIGAETNSSWTRDGIISAILNDRMEKFTTIYTSNLTMNELNSHFAKTTKEGINQKKADRLLERIEPFVKVVPVIGRNRRRDRNNPRG